MIDFKKFTNYSNFILLISSIIGGYIAIDNYYAKQHDFETLQIRFELKLLNDRLTSINERIWILQNSKTPEMVNELRVLQKEKNEVQGEIDRIAGKK